jgi:tryptophan 2,3-dioxygenase
MEDKKLLQKIKLLAEKYSATGQDLYSYLDGLLYADYMGYWNYIKLETLLSIQTPKTDFPDEKIFIIYHQITELYFKLCLIEIEHINKNGRNVLETGEDLGWNTALTKNIFIERMTRLNRYLSKMIDSFDIMIEGMDKKEFLKFRMALLPSSGFQSVQFRMIEIRSTDLTNLSTKSSKDSNLNDVYENLYWKRGANELATG